MNVIDQATIKKAPESRANTLESSNSEIISETTYSYYSTRPRRSKPGIMLYFDDFSALSSGLSDSELGQLLKALCAYSCTGVLPDFHERTLQLAFNMYLPKLDADTRRYTAACLSRAYAGYCSGEHSAGRTPLPRREWEERQKLSAPGKGMAGNEDCNENMPSDSASVNICRHMSTDAANSNDSLNPNAIPNPIDNIICNDNISVTVSSPSADTADTDKKRKRFSKPTVDEVQAYCAEKGYRLDAEAFVNFYESKGWVIGKSPMKDWKAAVRTWERNAKNEIHGRSESAGSKKTEFNIEYDN